MRQGIEKEREYELTRAIVTVMFHGDTYAFGVHNSACAREETASWLAAGNFRFNALSRSGWVSASPQRRRARIQSLSRTEKFPAEGLVSDSVLAVLVANPNTRSQKAFAILTTKMTEQRCCAAA